MCVCVGLVVSLVSCLVIVRSLQLVSIHIMYSPSTSVDDISNHPAPNLRTLVFYDFFCWIYWILGSHLLFGLHHIRLFGLHSLLDLNHIHQPGLYMPLALVFHMSEVVHMTEEVHMFLVEEEVEVHKFLVEGEVHMILVEVEVHMILVVLGLHLLLGQHHIHLAGLHLPFEICFPIFSICCLARVRPMLCFDCQAKMFCFHRMVFSLLVHHQSRSGIAFLASDWQDKTRGRGGLPPAVRAWWQLQKYFPEG